MLTPETKPAQIKSLDLLRGLLLAGIALLTTVHFFHNSASPAVTSAVSSDESTALSITRWFGHWCTTAFVFTFGTMAYSSVQSQRTRHRSARHLVKLGAMLILLDLTWVTCAGWTFAIQFHQLQGHIFWAMGWGLIVLYGLMFLPLGIVSATGIALLALHNLFDFVPPEASGSFTWAWNLFVRGGSVELGHGITFQSAYPLLPWTGVLTTGYAIGALLEKPAALRQHWLLRTGVNLLVVFFLLRFTNLYGNPTPWSSKPTGWQTLLSLLSCSPNPPSLCHVLLSFGIAAIILAWLDWGKPHFLGPLATLGQVPIFFLSIHLPIIHGLAVAVNFIRFDRADWLYGAAPAEPPPKVGFDLPHVLLAWFIVLLLLYPLCQWLSDVKSRHKHKWRSGL